LVRTQEWRWRQRWSDDRSRVWPFGEVVRGRKTRATEATARPAAAFLAAARATNSTPDAALTGAITNTVIKLSELTN
jgi:hypothetical protein